MGHNLGFILTQITKVCCELRNHIWVLWILALCPLSAGMVGAPVCTQSAIQAVQGDPQHVLLHDGRPPVHGVGGDLRPLLRHQSPALSHRRAGLPWDLMISQLFRYCRDFFLLRPSRAPGTQQCSSWQPSGFPSTESSTSTSPTGSFTSRYIIKKIHVLFIYSPVHPHQGSVQIRALPPPP